MNCYVKSVYIISRLNNFNSRHFFQLALKHRQGKNHKMRIVAFIGSPIMTDEKEVTKLAKRLKKEKVNVDIVSFGEDVCIVFILNLECIKICFPMCILLLILFAFCM